MKKILTSAIALLLFITCICCASVPAFAAEEADDAAVETVVTSEEAAAHVSGAKAWSAGILMAVAAAAGAIAMGISISKSASGISRQPEAAGNIRTSMMLGLVFIETAIIYALIIAILIIFVL